MQRTLSLLLCLAATGAAAQLHTIPPRGSLAFWFHLEQEYRNGVDPSGPPLTLLEAPGVLRVSIEATSSLVALTAGMRLPGGRAQNVGLELPGLPGPAWYHLVLQWDSAAGRFDGFLNGLPMRVPGTPVPAWAMEPQTVPIQPASNVEGLVISPELWSEEAIASRLQVRPHNDVAPLLGWGTGRAMTDVEPLKGPLVYAADFTTPGVLDAWHMEGPGKTRIDPGGWLHLESTQPDAPHPGGHIVYWPPVPSPPDFVAQWDIQPESYEGLCIVFFAATGRNAEDVFDPRLAPRRGVFTQYTMGDINCYHISYYANTPGSLGRITSNMRKNNGFYVVANGPPGIPAGSQAVHRVTLLKQGAHVQLGVDGGLIIDFTDDGERYGPVLGGGKIGLRQMQWMQARYRDFRVWALQ